MMADEYKGYVSVLAQDFVKKETGLDLPKKDIFLKKKEIWTSRYYWVKCKDPNDKRKRIDVGILIVDDLDMFVEKYYQMYDRDRKLTELGII
jgi:hypothetical protein